MTYVILLFSSVGNVAMSVPVVESVARLQPNDTFVFVSQKRLDAMFFGIPNLKYVTIDFKANKHANKSITTLVKEVTHTYGRIDYVIDLQDVWRTRLCRFLLRLRGAKTAIVDKHKHSKRLLRLRGYKYSSPLPTAHASYAAAFEQAGLKTDTCFCQLQENKEAAEKVAQFLVEKTSNQHLIGLAPFAKHRTNMLPTATTKMLLHKLINDENTTVFLFGAGKVECKTLELWAQQMPKCVNVAGVLPLDEELELMRQLDVMICMDSANQHLASLVGLRAISIWCGTHPYTGYYGWKQNAEDCIEQPLSCRPCSNHGKNRCNYWNYLCQDIAIKDIIQKISVR